MNFDSLEEEVEYTAQNVSGYSSPSDLEITDLRYVQVGNTPITRIDTNHNVYGLGDVRDAADPRYALMLKSRLLGRDPTNVEALFKRIKPLGDHGRQGGGVAAVETTLWDLAGKAYGVPLYQLLGGKYRDQIRIYADTPTVEDPQEFGRRMKSRADDGFSVLKMDVGSDEVDHISGTTVNRDFWMERDGGMSGWNGTPGSYGATEHPFTRVQVTEKGLEEIAGFVEATREAIGYGIPLGIDHLGHFGYNEAIKIAERLEEYSLAFLEDLVPWFYTDQ